MWTAILILVCLVAEALLAIEGRALVEVGQRDVGMQARLFDRRDVLRRAIRRVPGHLLKW